MKYPYVKMRLQSYFILRNDINYTLEDFPFPLNKISMPIKTLLLKV